MRGRKLKRNILMVGLITTLCLMGIGYAAFQTSLTIKGTGTVVGKWDIEITNVTDGTAIGYAENATAPTYSALTANMEANLYDKGAAMVYDVTIENKGSIDATLDEIQQSEVSNDAIKIAVTGYTKGEVLASNSSKTVRVTISYDENYEGDAADGSSGTLSVTFVFGQAESAEPVSGGGTPVTVSKYKLSFDCTTNGLSSCSSNDEYYKEGTEVSLSTKPATDKKGYNFKGWATSANGTTYITSYTMGDSDTTLYAIYEAKPGPLISNVSTTSTTDSINVVVTADGNGSNITTYEYSKDGGDTWRSSTSNTYTFEGLQQNTEYTIYVRVVNENEGTGYSSKTKVSTKAIGTPTFVLSELDGESRVTITYPDVTKDDGTTLDCSNGLTCEYSKNGFDFVRVNSNTEMVSFSDKGTLIARVSDGTNTTTSTTYSVTVGMKVTYDYSTNGGTSSTKTDDRVYIGSSIDLTPTATKTGYTFKGWNTDRSATVGLESLEMGNQPVTLYAIFVDDVVPNVSVSPNEQTTYVADGQAVTVTLADAGSGLAASQNIYYAWAASNEQVPTFTDYVTTTNSAGINTTTVTVPANDSANLTGTYYLWIKAGIKDVSNNESVVKTSGEFNFDNDDPELTVSTTVTSSTVTIVASASAESGIDSYSFTLDGSEATCESETEDNICLITGLTHDTTYTVSATVTSGVNKTTTASPTTSPKTTKIDTPEYLMTKAGGSGVVRITYPSVCSDSAFKCTYQKDSETVQPVTADTSGVTVNEDGTLTIDVPFSKTGEVKTTVSDGTNDINSSYSFAVEATMLSYDNTKTGLNCSTAQCAIDGIKELLD